MLGWGDPPGAPFKPALSANIPRLCVRDVGSSWLGRSPRGELLWWWARVADQGGHSLLGGEMGEVAQSIWEFLWKLYLLGTHHPGEGRDTCPGLLKPCAKNAGGTGVLEVLGRSGGAEGAKGAGVPEQRGVPCPLGLLPGCCPRRGAQAAGQGC